jgi:BRCA1-associated RING domain protein 1
MDKEADNHQRENQQTDQRNIFNPSRLPQRCVISSLLCDIWTLEFMRSISVLSFFPSQCSKKEGISTNSSRDGQQIDQLETSDSSSLQVGYATLPKIL